MPIALAGKTVTCTGCGQPLVVPALGIAVPAGKRAPQPHTAPSPFASLRSEEATPARRRRWSSCATALVLVCAGLLLLTAGSVGLWHLGFFDRLPTINLAERWQPVREEPAPDVPPENKPAPPPETKPALPKPVTPEPAAPADPEAPPIPLPQPKRTAPANKPIALKPPVGVKPVLIEEKKPAVPAALPKGPFQAGDTFLQDVRVTQKSRFLVQGIAVATLLQYRIVSRYTVEKVNVDGGLSVKQKIESATLLQADELTQGLLAGPVTQLPGTAFTLEVSPRGEVTRFASAGGLPPPRVAGLPGGLGVQMASLLDADGWKELGQATFYQPEDRAKAGRWKRPLTHNWGPLGNWAGDMTFAYPGPGKAEQVKVPYTLKITYRSPKGPGVPGRCRSR